MDNNEKCTCACERHKAKPRSEEELRLLQNRVRRITGQLGGISRMLDENRYCGDVLTQVAAAQSALQALGEEILRQHLSTCVIDGIRDGNDAILMEAFDLMRKLK